MSLAAESVQERAADHLASTARITPADLRRARAAARAAADGTGAAFHLVELGIVDAPTLRAALTRVTGESAVSLEEYPPERDVAGILPARRARELRAVPIARSAAGVEIAVADPYNLEAIREVQDLTRLDVRARVTDEHSLLRRIAALADAEPGRLASADQIATAAVSELATQRARPGAEAGVETGAARASVPRLVEHILHEGVRRGASDIHVEFFRAGGRVRFRVDGALVEWETRLPVELEEDLVGRIKVLTRSMDTSNRRVPQDGRIRHVLPGGRAVDFRVSTLPTVRGEKAVLRILDQEHQPLDFARLGIEGANEATLRAAMGATTGMILLTGPTGSGKSTTLYSILSLLADPAVNIITVEDPVERELDGITQVSVRPADHVDTDLSYEPVLRAMLRQDPEILMVGEIRDADTARIATRAAMTGHLILSTLHANDAPATVTRLLDMGLEPYNLVGALRLVIAQRLLRRICAGCRVEYRPEAEHLAALGTDLRRAREQIFYHGRGCAECGGTGYRGRIGIYSMMPLTERVKPLILARRDEREIGAAAAAAGMETLAMAGWKRVRQGLTTVAEVIRETA